MIMTLRKHAQSWVIKLLLGLIAVTFVFVFGVGQFTASKLVLVEVGGKEILASQFNREYEREMDDLRQRFPANAEVLAQQLNLRRQVYDRMIERELMLAEAARQGLRVTDREVSDSITSEAFFRWTTSSISQPTRPSSIKTGSRPRATRSVRGET